MLPLTSRLLARPCRSDNKCIISGRNDTSVLLLKAEKRCDAWIGNHSQQQQQQQIRHHYPNYYGASLKRPKLTYTIDDAVRLLREQCQGNPNSMVSTQITMNLDWRVKTQRIAGVFDMPHSTGKIQSIAAATLDLEIAEEALKAGANHAGDLAARLLSNEVQYPKHFDLMICTTELAHEMTGKTKLGSKLKRHGITPTTVNKTLVESEELVETVRKYAHGYYTPYKNDTHGNVGTRLGRFLQPDCNIIDNFHYVLRQLFDTQLTQFGNGPDAKKKNIGKYILTIHVTASQGDSFNLNLDSIDILRELNQQEIPLHPGQRWRMKKIKN